jgi:hypothetical protein
MFMTLSPALRAKLYDEDRALLGKEYRDRWLTETKQRKDANADMERLYSLNKMPPRKFSLFAQLKP